MSILQFDVATPSLEMSQRLTIEGDIWQPSVRNLLLGIDIRSEPNTFTIDEFADLTTQINEWHRVQDWKASQDPGLEQSKKGALNKNAVI